MLINLTLTPTLPLTLILTEGETDAVLQAILGTKGCVHTEEGRALALLFGQSAPGVAAFCL